VISVGWLRAELGEVPEDDAWLFPAERERLASLHLPWRRADWRLGRWAAKKAVAAHLGHPVGPIEIRPAADGAPEAFLNGLPAQAVISLTHRAGRAVCAAAPAGCRLGCDLEAVEPRSDAFIADFFTLDERSFVALAPEAHRPLLANLIWSAKESALKALREGLRRDTRSVEITLRDEGDGGWSPFTADCMETFQTFHGWWRLEGDLLLTVAAAPAPAVPVQL
jgi:4'-phosphopantetheinyl transferase